MSFRQRRRPTYRRSVKGVSSRRHGRPAGFVAVGACQRLKGVHADRQHCRCAPRARDDNHSGGPPERPERTPSPPRTPRPRPRWHVLLAQRRCERLRPLMPLKCSANVPAGSLGCGAAFPGTDLAAGRNGPGPCPSLASWACRAGRFVAILSPQGASALRMDRALASRKKQGFALEGLAASGCHPAAESDS